MITISPLKVLIVLVVALLLLGPDKVPQAARQIGAGWSAFRKFRQRMEEEIRETVPDLPATHEIVRAVRSPMSFLDNLADLHGDTTTKDEPDTSASDEGDGGSAVGEEKTVQNKAVPDKALQDKPQTGTEESTETGTGLEVGSAPAQAPPPVVGSSHGGTRSYRFTVPDDPSLN